MTYQLAPGELLTIPTGRHFNPTNELRWVTNKSELWLPLTPTLQQKWVQSRYTGNQALPHVWVAVPTVEIS